MSTIILFIVLACFFGLLFGILHFTSGNVNNESVVTEVFKVADYTYRPLLGLSAFGILTKRQVKDCWGPILGLSSPVLTYIINANSEAWLSGYKFGFELLFLNGFLMFT